MLDHYTCSHCLSVELNKCIIEDDMEEMLKSFKQSDIVIYATPLYFDNVTGMMKMFFDRSLSMVAPYVGLDENGEYRHIDKLGFSDSFVKVPKLVAVSNCAFPEQSQFQVLSYLFKRMARNIHTELIAEIYRGEGPILREMVPELSPFVEEYKKLLRKAGREMVELMKLTEETKEQLQKPLIPHDAYVKGWNASIDNDWNRSDTMLL